MMRSEMEQDILKVLITEEELKTRITELGNQLYDRFQGRNPLFLGVLHVHDRLGSGLPAQERY